MVTMMLTTRTLAATDTDGVRVRVRASEGSRADYPHTYALHGPEFHEDCVLRLARTLFPTGARLKAERTRTHKEGYAFRVRDESGADA